MNGANKNHIHFSRSFKHKYFVFIQFQLLQWELECKRQNVKQNRRSQTISELGLRYSFNFIVNTSFYLWKFREYINQYGLCLIEAYAVLSLLQFAIFAWRRFRIAEFSYAIIIDGWQSNRVKWVKGIVRYLSLI